MHLAVRHLPAFRLPDKAVDLLDKTAASVRIGVLPAPRSADGQPRVGSAEVAAVIAQRCRVPAESVGEDEARRLRCLEEDLRQEVFGQDEALRTVADVIRAKRAGLGFGGRPLSFLFAGAAGSGKTALATALARALGGNAPGSSGSTSRSTRRAPRVCGCSAQARSTALGTPRDD